MDTHKIIYDRYNQIINESEYELDEVERNEIAKNVGIDYIINDLNKREAIISSFFAFSKLFLHSSLTEIYPSLGIDVVISPKNITVSSILRHVRRGRIHSVNTIRDGFGEVIEAEAMETSSLVGVPLSESGLPDGVLVGAIVRNDKVIVPRGDTIIESNDRIVLFTLTENVREIEKMLSVRLEYF